MRGESEFQQAPLPATVLRRKPLNRDFMRKFLRPPGGSGIQDKFRIAERRDTGQQAGSFKEPLPGRLCPDIVYTDQWGRAQSPEGRRINRHLPLVSSLLRPGLLS